MDPDHHHSQEQGSGGYHHDVHDQWVSGGPSPYQSHHQSPVNEYTAFNFSGLPMEPMYVTTAPPMMPPQARSTSHQQLQPLMVPPWPSQLTSANSAYPSAMFHHTPVSATTPITTPMSAPPTTGRHSDRPRKTLTDADRRRMCKYAEDHPTVKQTEIGAMFGVERSTVSKVLRNKEKYLKQEETKQDQKPKGKFPDIEKALGSWVKNRQKAGQPITDALIQDQLKHFSTTVGGPEAQPQATSSWLEKFKVKNGLLGSKSRKSSVADESDSGNILDSPGQQATPSISPTSPQNKRDHSPSRLSMALDEGIKEHKRVKSESPPDDIDASPISISSQTHKPFASISSAFTDVPSHSSQQHTHSSSFSLSPIRPHSPFFNPFAPDQPLSNAHGGQSSTATFRQRSQTFPMSTAPVEASAIAGYASPPLSNSDATTGNKMTPSAGGMESPVVVSSSRGSTSKQSSVIDPLSPHFGLPVSSEGLLLSAISSGAIAAASNSGGRAPSVAETQHALQTVWNFFQHQPLEPEEYAMMGKLMEKLKLHQSTAAAAAVSDGPFGLSAAAYAVGRSGAE